MKIGDMYAYIVYPHAGTFFVMVSFDSNTFHCLSLPDMYNEMYTPKEIKDLVDVNVIEYVDTIPTDILKVCQDQFNSNNEIYERLQNL